MRVTKNWLMRFLNLLADFLNQDFKKKTWKSFLSHAGEFGNILPSEFSGQEGMKKAKGLQIEIRSNLRDIIEGDPVAEEAKQTGWPRPNLYESLFTLIENLNGLRLQQRWQVMPANKKAAKIMECDYYPLRPRPGQVFAEFRGSKWLVENWPLTVGARAFLYSIIGTALENGELPRLRVCLHCHKYFVAEDLKRKFCKDKCKEVFHNKRRLAEGYFREHRRMSKKAEQAKAWRL